MNNGYPPGVSGNEDAFGPRNEYDVLADDTYNCWCCGLPAPLYVTRLIWNYSVEDVWYCPKCGFQNQIELGREDA